MEMEMVIVEVRMERALHKKLEKEGLFIIQ
jgi:hypothetical protein